MTSSDSLEVSSGSGYAGMIAASSNADSSAISGVSNSSGFTDLRIAATGALALAPHRENPITASSDDGSETINRESGGFHVSSSNFDGTNDAMPKRIHKLTKRPAILSETAMDESVSKVTMMVDGHEFPVEPPSPRLLMQQS